MFLLSCAWTASAQTPNPEAAPAPSASPAPPVAARDKESTGTPPPLDVEGIEPREARLNDKISLTIPNLTDLTHAKKLILYLDDNPIKGNYPTETYEGGLVFDLKRDDKNKDVWNHFLSRPRDAIRETEVKVGYEDQGPAGKGERLDLRIYNQRYFNFVVIGFLLALGVFLYLARTTNIIRDSGPPEIPAGAVRPYSLARAQIAWWFFIIFGSFLLIRIVTDDINTLNTTALVLLGIGSGTALSALIVDNSKRDSTLSALRALKPKQATLQVAIAELKAQVAGIEAKKSAGPSAVSPPELETLSAARRDLAGKEAELEQVARQVVDVASALDKPVSEDFLKDIFSDVNGVSFHRFQMVVWTITLGFIFIKSVYGDLAMPEFSDTILTLMGISAGTYIGFKIPERQTDPAVRPDLLAAGTGDGGAA
jgi:hypothetical protein